MTSRQIYSNMKKLSLFIIIASVLFSAAAFYSYAANFPVFRNRYYQATNTAGGGFQNNTNLLQNLKERADKEIERRIKVLNNLLERLGDIKRLSPSEASSFESQVQSEITDLNVLKTKIDSDTDITTLRTDVRSIIGSYRVFAFFIVDINLTITADRMTRIVDNMTLVYNKLSVRIQKQQKEGKNVTELLSLLSDMNTNLNNAKTTIQGVQTELSGLSVQGYPQNRVTLLDARQKLKTAFSYIKTAFSDGKRIILGLEANGSIQNNNLGRENASQSGNQK